ncbi:hypothetical protein N7462_003758 [Penicillium macrosclerotiorum]|uniref:uncharacterized protein n=1 Tax=Penicillium macrosclerotiorum TaxID=303699 RepID=UPI00254917A8|nr:uncharacterized protein N7462_003758 [Penicillium macrosclerotiorum]KAJ5689366.1 hypothetical protein N7462_003758 [Penicillium macrosclerotiorum]
MQSDCSREARAGAYPPIKGPSPQGRSNFSQSAHPTHNGQYIELDDFGPPESPVLNDGHHVALSKKSRRAVYIPNTLWTRSFATAVILETLVTVGIESWIFISISKEFGELNMRSGTTRLRSFLGLYIFALLYELGLSYDALRRKNTFQLIGLCVCNTGLLTYGCMQIKEIRDTITNVVANTARSNKIWAMYYIELILVPVFIGVGTAVMIFVTWKLRAEFSWSIYKNISADLRMNRRYTIYQVYIALLKFDFYFIFGTQLQVLLAVQDFKNQEFFVTAAMVPVAIVALILAALFCRREKTKSLILMMLMMCIIAGTFVMTLVHMYGQGTVSNDLSSYRVSLTLFAIIAMLLISTTLVNSLMCILNFNKGLKEYIVQSRSRQPTTGQSNPSWSADVKSRFVLN